MALLRGRRRPQSPLKRDYDERVYHRGHAGLGNLTLGLIAIAVLAVATYAAVAKAGKLWPFAPAGLELNAVFEDASTLRADSPVRIAGVDVGSVESIEPHGDGSVVTFEVGEMGQPVHEDATVEIRPRLFLEGNFFLDLRPGSPRAAELESGATLPVTQTATAVQLDEVLTALQSDDRENLQATLEGLGTALTYEPTAEDDETQDPEVFGETAAESINDSFEFGGPAGRGSAIVNTALLGERPHDLSGLIRAQERVFRVLSDREEQLKGLITNFNVTAGAFAAESANLSATIRELAPTLEQGEPALARLNTVFPPLRAFARALEPSLRELPATIDAANPWLAQADPLLSRRELGGIARILRESAPALARTSASGRRLFQQINLLSRCTSENLIPAGDQVIDDAGGEYPFTTGQPNYRAFFYAAVGLAGESQGFDGNGPYVRFQPGGGDQLVAMDNPGGGFQASRLWANTIEPPLGIRPVLPNEIPPIRSDVECHRNAVPNINSARVGPPVPAEFTP
jgi:phospholipid/cholesterol/gamma-HCH transport system substrate-binding protein